MKKHLIKKMKETLYSTNKDMLFDLFLFSWTQAIFFIFFLILEWIRKKKRFFGLQLPKFYSPAHLTHDYSRKYNP